MDNRTLTDIVSVRLSERAERYLFRFDGDNPGAEIQAAIALVKGFEFSECAALPLLEEFCRRNRIASTEFELWATLHQTRQIKSSRGYLRHEAMTPILSQHWERGLQALSESLKKQTEIDDLYGWPEGTTRFLTESRLMGVVEWHGREGIAFPMQRPRRRRDSDPVMIDEVGFHLWHSLNEEENFHSTLRPKTEDSLLPFVLGAFEIKRAKRIVVVEGYWQAVTLAAALKWLDGYNAWPTGTVLFGIPDSNRWNALIESWGALWPSEARFVIFSNEKAACWTAPRGLVARLRELGHHVSVRKLIFGEGDICRLHQSRELHVEFLERLLASDSSQTKQGEFACEEYAPFSGENNDYGLDGGAASFMRLTLDPGRSKESNLLGNGFLRKGGARSVLTISGPTGIGKSSLVLQALTLWGLGRPIFGITPSRPLKSFYVQAENDCEDLWEAKVGISDGLALSAAEQDLVAANVFVRMEQNRGARLFRAIDSLVREIRPDIIVFDPLLAYLIGDISKQEDVGHFLRDLLSPFLQRQNVAVILIHHTGKPPTTRRDGRFFLSGDATYAGIGSSELANFSHSSILLRPTDAMFELKLAKRGNRAGLTDREGSPASSVFIQHSKVPKRVFWEWATVSPKQQRASNAKDKKLEEVFACLLECAPGKDGGVSGHALAAKLKTSNKTLKRLFDRNGKTLHIEGEILEWKAGRIHRSPEVSDGQQR